MTQRGFWKLFPDKFHLYLLRKKCFKKIVWKNFPEILLSHHPKIVNFNFYLKSCILEKFSKNSPESWPKIFRMAFGFIFQKTSWVTTRIFRCDQFWTQIIKIGNLRGLLLPKYERPGKIEASVFTKRWRVSRSFTFWEVKSIRIFLWWIELGLVQPL